MPAQPILYAPRMAAALFVADVGLPAARAAQALETDTFRLDLRPIKARCVSNSYRKADECDITFSFDEAGIDPRYLRSAELYVWIGDSNVPANAVGGDVFTPNDANLRFIGIVRDVAREFDTTSKIVTIRAVDYTSLWLEMSKFPPSHNPTFADTLRTAYKRIARWTGHVDLSDPDDPTIISSICDPDSAEGAFDGEPRIPLTALGNVNLDTPIGASVPARIAKNGTMVTHTGCDSWAVWMDVCESQGLISWIQGDVCIVANATEYYTANDPPLLIYGQNILTLTERRDLGQVSSKNICVRSYDGLAGTCLEAFFPPTNSPLSRKIPKKKVLPSAKKASEAAIIPEEFENIDLQIPCSSQAKLNEIAEMIWMQRVRQELSGTLTTKEMRVSTQSQGAITDASGNIIAPGRQNFDLLSLRAGDNIYVGIGADALDNIQSLPTVSARRGALVARGYSVDMAVYISDNLSSLTGPGALPPLFLVHQVETEFDAGNNSFNVKIEFINTLDLSGGATINDGDSPIISDIQFDTVPDVDGNGDIIFDTAPDGSPAGDIQFDTPPDNPFAEEAPLPTIPVSLGGSAAFAVSLPFDPSLAGGG